MRYTHALEKDSHSCFRLLGLQESNESGGCGVLRSRSKPSERWPSREGQSGPVGSW